MLRQLVAKKKESMLDESIQRVLNDLGQANPETEKYSELLANLERLITLRDREKRGRVSPDTMAIVVTNLLGILIIVGYEQRHVWASKAIPFLLKTKHQ